MTRTTRPLAAAAMLAALCAPLRAAGGARPEPILVDPAYRYGMPAEPSEPFSGWDWKAAPAPAPDRSLLMEFSGRAHAVGEDSSDQALAALYQRLFALQDKRREVELRSDTAELDMDDLTAAYVKLDNYRWPKSELKEIAVNPDHPRYPNITETGKIKLLEEFRQRIRTQKLAELENKKIDRDVAEVRDMIRAHLERRPGGGTPTPKP